VRLPRGPTKNVPCLLDFRNPNVLPSLHVPESKLSQSVIVMLHQSASFDHEHRSLSPKTRDSSPDLNGTVRTKVLRVGDLFTLLCVVTTIRSSRCYPHFNLLFLYMQSSPKTDFTTITGMSEANTDARELLHLVTRRRGNEIPKCFAVSITGTIIRQNSSESVQTESS
jgi:hypothetical protein